MLAARSRVVIAISQSTLIAFLLRNIIFKNNKIIQQIQATHEVYFDATPLESGAGELL
jgi:hypothetical protein